MAIPTTPRQPGLIRPLPLLKGRQGKEKQSFFERKDQKTFASEGVRWPVGIDSWGAPQRLRF
jgi:hypothetical protein